MASLTRCTWVWASSGSWWWIERPGMLQSMGSQGAGHDWATELNWDQYYNEIYINFFFFLKQTQIKWPAQGLMAPQWWARRGPRFIPFQDSLLSTHPSSLFHGKASVRETWDNGVKALCKCLRAAQTSGLLINQGTWWTPWSGNKIPQAANYDLEQPNKQTNKQTNK